MQNNAISYPPLSKQHFSDLLKLKQKKFCIINGKTLAEGVNLIGQLCQNGISPSEIITSQPHLADVFAEKVRCRIYLTGEKEMAKLTETTSPAPLVSVMNIPKFELKNYKRLLYLAGIKDPGNMGTMFRIAAAFNWDGVVLAPECCEVFSPKVIRASLGSVFWLPSDTKDTDWLKGQNAVKIGLEVRAKQTLDEFTQNLNPEQALILVIGSEAEGISSQIKQELTLSVKIPLCGRMESLNAAVAAGIAIYEFSRNF